MQLFNSSSPDDEPEPPTIDDILRGVLDHNNVQETKALREAKKREAEKYNPYPHKLRD